MVERMHTEPSNEAVEYWLRKGLGEFLNLERQQRKLERRRRSGRLKVEPAHARS